MAVVVKISDRIDEKTIICSVGFDDPDTTEFIRTLVHVPASLNEVPDVEDPTKVPSHIRIRAIMRAHNLMLDANRVISKELKSA